MPKPTLRKIIRARLAALEPAARAQKSALLCEAIAQTPQWRATRTVGIFAPMADEPDIEPLWHVPGERTICYPRINGTELLFFRIPEHASLPGALHANPCWNAARPLREPLHREEHLIIPEELDLLLLPGLAFTVDGHRMGRGKGFYDRFLARPGLRATTFGICFAEQIVPQLPQEEHDCLVDRVFFA